MGDSTLRQWIQYFTKNGKKYVSYFYFEIIVAFRGYFHNRSLSFSFSDVNYFIKHVKYLDLGFESKVKFYLFTLKYQHFLSLSLWW